jgi:uncharacterized protein YdeI (YjbR/CyaY-like superfamily)
MEIKDGIKAFYPKSRSEWRNWLNDNHLSEKSVWLIMYKKQSGEPTITYNEAVEEALCFGWIDSKPNKRDEKSFYQYFTKRNPKSVWSKLNKERVSVLLGQGLMAQAGIEAMEIAKKNGSWSILDEIDNLHEPDDLRLILAANPNAKRNWENFPASAKKGILFWISSAKQPATRQNRIEQIVRLAAENKRANEYIPKKNEQ